MKNFLCCLIILLILGSCATWKKGLFPYGEQDEAICNAILDFVNTSKVSKADSVFNLLVAKEKDFYIIGIASASDPIFYRAENAIGTNQDMTFPTKYKIIRGRLFLWYDRSDSISKELIDVLNHYHHLDTLWQEKWTLPPSTINDNPDGRIYYICIDNIKNYRKFNVNNKQSYRKFNFKCE